MALATPQNVTWTRLNDQDLTLSWSKVPGATKYQIALQTGGAKNPVVDKWTTTGTSFTARRFRVNNGFRMAVKAWDNKGNSSEFSAFTPWFYTPPPKIKKPTVQVTTEGLLVKWSRAGTYYAHGAQVQVEGGATTTLGNGTNGAAPTEVLLAVTGLGMRVRVRGFVGAEGSQSRVFGDWSDWSDPVNALTAPNPPLVLAPTGFAASWSATMFEWKHSPTDGTAQSGVEVRYRVEGTTTWTVKTGTTAQSLAVTLAAGVYEFQIRTKGLSGVYGDWSPVGVFVVITRPVVTVTAPNPTLSRLTVSWSWSQAEGLPQSSVIVSLLRGSEMLEQRRGTGPATQTTFDTVLQNGVAYTVRVEAACGGLYAATKTQSWTTSFTPPTAPIISAMWVESGGYHEITVAPGTGGSKATVTLDVHRDAGDGWEPVAVGLPPSESVLADYLGLTYGDTTYRVTAWTSEGASAAAQVTVETRSGQLWVRWEQTAVGIKYNPEMSYTPERHDEQLIYFDGETMPTLIEGEGVSRTASVSGTLLPEWLADGADPSAPQARQVLESLALGAGVLPTLSTPDRLTITGALSVQFSTAVGGLCDVQLSVKEAQ